MSPDKPPSFTVAHPPEARPLLIFDGDCGFCRLWIERWQEMTGDRIEYAPSQEVAGRFAEIPAAVFDSSVVLVETNGTATTGAEAVTRTLERASPRGWGPWLYRRVPGAARLAQFAYRRIAAHRSLFSTMTRLSWGKEMRRPCYFLSAWSFSRLMGIVYCTAFVSLWVQIHGLIGSDGILPIAPYLKAAEPQLGAAGYWLLPTVLWLGAGDAALHAVCAAGTVASLLIVAGIFPGPLLLLEWGLYLSLVTGGRTFLSFQWDNLLLETGLIASFLAAWRLRDPLRQPRRPPRLARFLLVFLLFRLMLASGVVKLSSGDPTWHDLTALQFHYFTQPLPPWTAWYMWQLPGWFHQVSAAVMFGIELIAPFLLFGPRRLRLAGAGLLASLQIAIAATGNYGFFNLLSIILCLLLVDDTVWPARWRPATVPPTGPGRHRPRWLVLSTLPLAGALLLLGTVQLVDSFRLGVEWPSPVRRLERYAAPLRTVNRYGLFAVMTTRRPEIIIEGSHDQRTWIAYEFRWKPGDPSRAPRFMAPHMPRLDWQMWFAALGDYRSHPWFSGLCARLLEGSPDVLALMADNPFPDGPPGYIRSMIHDYRFAEAGGSRPEGVWWRREIERSYTPIFSLKQDRDRL